MAFIKSHAGNNIYIRSGLDNATKEILAESEATYLEQLENTALPLCEEWWSHFSLRDTMQDGLSKDRNFPKKRTTYFAGDYQD